MAEQRPITPNEQRRQDLLIVEECLIQCLSVEKAWGILDRLKLRVPCQPLNRERIAAATERLARGEGRDLDDVIRDFDAGK